MLAASTKYAIKTLQFLAKQPGDLFIQVPTLSSATDVPGPYLAKVIRVLAERKIVETKRGISGGVKLAPGAEKLSLYSVCIALEDPVVVQNCLLSKDSCNAKNPCPLHHEWRAAKDKMIAFLHETKVDY